MDKNSAKDFFVNLLRDDKKELRIIISIATLGAVLSVFIPYIYGRLFDLALIPNTTISLLFSLIGIWIILGLISNYTSTKTAVLGEVLGAKTSLKSEAEAYSHFLTLPISFHKTKKAGTIIEKVSRGSWNIQYLIEIISDILPSVLFLIFALIAMVIIKWELALIICFSFVVYSFVTVKMTKPVLKSQKKMHKIFEKEYGNVYDKLYNVFLVKNFAMEENEKKEFFKSFVKKAVPPYKESAEKTAKLSHAQGVIYNLSFVIVLGIAIFFLRNGQITQGEFIMFFGYITLSFSPFFKLAQFYRYYKRTSVSVRRLIWLKNLVPEEAKHGDKILKDFKGKIEFRNVSFNYTKDREVLKNINLKINPGETMAFVGESGVGKTTLSELILGYYKLNKGEILLDDINISKLKLKWLRKNIAIVPQEISIFNDTLINNIKYANPNSSYEDIVKATKAAYAHEFILSLPKKYKTLVGERGIKLSTGQKQRIAITMAFLKNPKILILDEPTSSLDVESEKNVQRGIKELIKGRTTLIIAHRFSTLRNADRIVVLDKGKIIEIGSHHELMKKRGKYYKFYKLQKGLN